MKNMTPKDLLIAGRLVFRKKAPYFQRVVQKLIVVETPGLGTIGVTASGVLMWDPEFIARQKSADKVGFLWCHEVLHVWSDHGARRGLRDPRMWNMAVDLAINTTCRELGFANPDGADQGLWPKDFGLPEGETADFYYAELSKQAQAQQGKPDDGGAGEPGAGEPGAGEPGDGAGAGEPGAGEPGAGEPGVGDVPGTGKGWCGSCAGRAMPNEPDAGEGRMPSELDRARRQVAEAIQRAATKGRGNIPAGLVQDAAGMLAPSVVPWDQKLRSACRRAAAWGMGAVDYRYDMPSRRQASVGFGVGKPVMPRLRSPKPEVSFVIDTSASMGSEETRRALSEAEAVMRALGVGITFLACDCDTYGLQRVQSVRQVVVTGGGGTDFRPAFAELEKARPRPNVVIFATDGQGPAPAQAPPRLRVIWLLVGDHKQRPYADGDYELSIDYGEFIEVEEV